MDRYFLQPLPEISDSPEGALDDGLPPDRERVGPLRIGDKSLAIELVRVDEGGAKVWLVSSATLASVPAFLPLIRPQWLERTLPAALAQWSIGGVSVPHLSQWLLSWAGTLLAMHLLLLAARAALGSAPPPGTRREALAASLDRARWPLALVVTLAVHLLAVGSFGTSLTFRIGYRRFVGALLVAALSWASHRLLGLLFARARFRLQGPRRTGAQSLLHLGERLVNVLLVLATVLILLAIAGVDIRTTLAGLGIVGFVVALGARKTVENILGGVMLLGDQAIAIGDDCKVAGRQGRVEDITLRSVRIRTREQTLLSIPAGVLDSADIENFSTRGKILANNMLRLAHFTRAAQIRAVRDGIEALLRANPLVEQGSASIRVVGLGVQAVELELFVFFLTPEWARFTAAREALLLEIAAVVEGAGASFAAPFVAAES
jgi:MscS family membrane protein